MCRFVAANLAVLAAVVAAAVAGSASSGWPWWAAVLVGCFAFFAGGWLTEKWAPGTRLLFWLGWSDVHE